MRNYLVILLVLLSLCLVPTVYGCSCLSLPKTFCSLADTEHTLLTGKVLRHYEKISLNDFPLYTFMDVQVTERINGENIQNTITILGKDGTSCGINLKAYDIGTNWLFKLRSKDRSQINVEELEHPLYRMSSCNINTLPIENDLIIGLVAPNMEEMSVANFKDNLDQCFLIIDDKATEAGITFKVRPTLVETQVKVIKGITHFGVERQDTQVLIINVNNQLVEKKILPAAESNLEIDMTFYPQGVYFLVFHTGSIIITEKIVKI